MNDQDRIETAADNCEVLRARLAKYEDADGKPITTIAEQAREIERLHANYNEACEDAMCVARELAALKAHPSGVVLPELRTVVTDAFMGMIAAVTSTTPPADQPPPPFIQSAIDRAVDRIGRINSSHVSAGDDAQYPPCDYCAEPLSYHPWHGSGLINGVESRHIHACDKCRHLLPTVSAGGVDERVPELSSFVAFADALGLDLRQSDDQWNSALALYEKLIAAYPQPSAALSAPSHGEQVLDGWHDGYRAAMNSAGWGVRELYVKHQHHDRVDGLLNRCKELEQSFIREADAMLAAPPSAGSQKGGE